MTRPANIPHALGKSPDEERAQHEATLEEWGIRPRKSPPANIPHALANVCVCIVGCAPEERIHAEGCPCRLHYPTPQEAYP